MSQSPQQKQQIIDTQQTNFGKKVEQQHSIPFNINKLQFSKEIQLYEMGPLIGTGSYATVKLATEKLLQKQVAIKIYDKKKLYEPQRLKNVRREINILSKINHQYIVKLFAVIDTKDSINLVMEYASTISLYQYLKSKPGRKLNETTCRKIFVQVIEGIKYLHDKNIIHRDIKLENILIDTEKTIKIIDFGFSQQLTQKDQKLTSWCGTPSYMPPEIVSKQEYLGFPVDIWSSGILLFVLFCGQFPFKGTDEKDLFKKIKGCQLEIPQCVPAGARQLLLNILKYNPLERISPKDILEDPWVKQYYYSQKE